MDNEVLQRRVLLLILSAGRRMLLMALIGGLIGLVFLALWVVQQVHVVAGLTAISILLAYVIAPAVDWLHDKRGISRLMAISIVYAGVVVMIVLGMAWVIPLLDDQFVALFNNLVGYLRNLQATIDSLFQWVLQISPEFARPWLAKIDPDSMRLERLAVEAQNAMRSSGVQALAGSTFVGVFSGMKMAAGLIAMVFLVPLFTFYILMDAGIYRDSFLRLFPARRKKDAAELIHEIDLVLGRYIRGQLVVCFTVGSSIAVVLSLIGLKYGLLIGVFAGIVDIIPYVGVALGIVPAFVVALVHWGLGWAILVVVLMETVHWLEGHIIVPNIIGHSVGLPPLVVMVSLLAGAELGGVMGMIFAIPTAAVLRVIVLFYIKRLEASDAEAARDQAVALQEIPPPPANGSAPEVSGDQSAPTPAALTEGRSEPIEPSA